MNKNQYPYTNDIDDSEELFNEQLYEKLKDAISDMDEEEIEKLKGELRRRGLYN